MKKPFVPKKYQLSYNETAKRKVIEVLCMFPEKEFSLSDLAKEAGVKKSNIGSILDEFHKEGLVQITKLRKLWRINANQGSFNFAKIKILQNLSIIYQAGLVEFLNDHFKNPKAIILFGSFRKGDDISTSDIDIAIESDDVKEYQVIGLRELAQLEKEIGGRKIQIHLFNQKNIDINVFNNIANGIVLWGFLQVMPWTK